MSGSESSGERKKGKAAPRISRSNCASEAAVDFRVNGIYDEATRERRAIQKMKNSDCSDKREVAEA